MKCRVLPAVHRARQYEIHQHDVRSHQFGHGNGLCAGGCRRNCAARKREIFLQQLAVVAVVLNDETEIGISVFV